MSKVIEKCSACGSTDLDQELIRHYSSHSMHVVGGSSSSIQPSLGGSSCNECGIIFKYPRKGKCPACDGTGEVEAGSGSVATWRSWIEPCKCCNGKGVIE